MPVDTLVAPIEAIASSVGKSAVEAGAASAAKVAESGAETLAKPLEAASKVGNTIAENAQESLGGAEGGQNALESIANSDPFSESSDGVTYAGFGPIGDLSEIQKMPPSPEATVTPPVDRKTAILNTNKRIKEAGRELSPQERLSIYQEELGYKPEPPPNTPDASTIVQKPNTNDLLFHNAMGGNTQAENPIPPAQNNDLLLHNAIGPSEAPTVIPSADAVEAITEPDALENS